MLQINDYGGKFSEHAKFFLNAGYRISQSACQARYLCAVTERVRLLQSCLICLRMVGLPDYMHTSLEYVNKPSMSTQEVQLTLMLLQMESLAEAVDAVICEVALTDEKHGKTAEEVDSRKRFIAGASMGTQNIKSGSEYNLTPPRFLLQVDSQLCYIRCKYVISAIEQICLLRPPDVVSIHRLQCRKQLQRRVFVILSTA